MTSVTNFPELFKRKSFVVPTTEAAQRLVAALQHEPAVGVDTETTGLDPWTSEGRLIILARRGAVYLIDCWRIDPAVVRPLMETEDGPVLVAHNWSFDLKVLARLGINVPSGRRLFDTMLAQQILDARAKRPKDAEDESDDDEEEHQRAPGLKEVAQRQLGLTLDKEIDHSVWSQPSLPVEALQYAGNDAGVLLPLHAALAPQITEAQMRVVWDAEMRCLPCVAWLELTGAPFDQEAWRALSDAALREQLVLEEQLDETVRREVDATAWRERLLSLKVDGHRERHPDQAEDLIEKWRERQRKTLEKQEHLANWGSHQQVRAAFLASGHDIESTGEDVLWSLVADGDPIAKMLLDYRDATARATRYGIKTLALANSVTGRLHTTYWQMGSTAGRFSSRNPNLQNIPRDKRYRACIRPAPGRVLIKADYNQIELRLAAQISGDEAMLQAYLDGKDLHVVTAALVLGADESAVSDVERQKAKATNFGLLYGMGIPRFRQQAASTYNVILSEDEATEIRNRWRREYAGLYAWQREHAGEYGVYHPRDTRTLLGRRRRFVYRYTEQLNSPVQGSGADGLKCALGLLWETRHRAPTAVPVLCIHDEIVVECAQDRVDETTAWLVTAMKEGMGRVLTALEPTVEVKVYRDWGVTPLG